MLYEWILLVSIIMGNQVHAEKIAEYNTKEECIAGARQVLGESYQQLRPAMYSQISLICAHTGEKTKT